MDRSRSDTRPTASGSFEMPETAVVRHVLVVMGKGPRAVRLASLLIEKNVFAHMADTVDRATRVMAGTLPISAVLLHRDVQGSQRLLASMVRSPRTRELPVVVLGDEPVSWNGHTVVAGVGDVDGLLDLLWRVC